MNRIASFVILFVAGYFLYLISGNIIIAIIGCLLLGIVFERRSMISARQFGSAKKESLMIINGRRLTRAAPLTSHKGTCRTICPTCGSEIEISYEFCTNCGQKLSPHEEEWRTL